MARFVYAAETCSACDGTGVCGDHLNFLDNEGYAVGDVAEATRALEDLGAPTAGGSLPCSQCMETQRDNWADHEMGKMGCPDCDRDSANWGEFTPSDMIDGQVKCNDCMNDGSKEAVPGTSFVPEEGQTVCENCGGLGGEGSSECEDCGGTGVNSALPRDEDGNVIEPPASIVEHSDEAHRGLNSPEAMAAHNVGFHGADRDVENATEEHSFYHEPVKCPECEGAGSINDTCDECDGEGIVECDTCMGDGEMECPTCLGETSVECDQCYGSGEGDYCGCSGLVCDECDGHGEIPTSLEDDEEEGEEEDEDRPMHGDF